MLWLCWVFTGAHRLSLVAASRGYTLVVVHKLLAVVASLVAEHGFQGMQASVAAASEQGSCGSHALECRLSSCDAQAQLLRGMWDFPGSGIQMVSLALKGGFSTTGPPGKPPLHILYVLSGWGLRYIHLNGKS